MKFVGRYIALESSSYICDAWTGVYGCQVARGYNE